MDRLFEVKLERVEEYRFDVELGDKANTVLVMDEPAPLGSDSGPNAARVLAGAIGHCLSASLLYCLDKSRIDVADVHAHVTGSIVRNPDGRLRLGALNVKLQPTLLTSAPGRVDRCLEIFEDFCIVTQSVRTGLDVAVEVDIGQATEPEKSEKDGAATP